MACHLLSLAILSNIATVVKHMAWSSWELNQGNPEPTLNMLIEEEHLCYMLALQRASPPADAEG